MITLGIETSCDETALCLLETEGASTPSTYRILGQTIFSQIEIHREFGGVFPMMAKRAHAENLVPLLEKLIADSGIKTQTIIDEKNKKNISEKLTAILGEKESELQKHIENSSLTTTMPVIDRIAVTHGPGLEPALWVGVNFARALAMLWNVPVVPTNHMEGHIIGSLLPNAKTSKDFQPLSTLSFPAIALLISGGHTEIIDVKAIGNYTIIGKTRDDAVGEAFDKTARMMGLSYPGGPEISRLAEEARKNSNVSNPANLSTQKIKLPRPMLHSHDLNFSFSGLKTAVLYLIRDLTDDERSLTSEEISTIAKEFEDAVTDVLLAKTSQAIDEIGAVSLVVGGGVIANNHIRVALERLANDKNIAIHLPPSGISGDNAVMIAIAGAFHPLQSPETLANIRAQGNLSISDSML